MMWVIDVINKIKDLWNNGLREFIIYGAIIITFVLSGLLRKLYRAIKTAIIGLFTVEGAVAFLIASAAVLFFLTKIGVIAW